MPSAKIENTTPHSTYGFAVAARNGLGDSQYSSMTYAQFNYNKASGGTPRTSNTDPAYPGADIVVNWNNTGRTWAVHSFPSPGDFKVVENPKPFDVVIVSGGRAGQSNGANPGAGGEGGKWLSYRGDDGMELFTTTYTVTIGSGGTGSHGQGGSSGLGTETIQGINQAGTLTTNIRGVSEQFSGGGGGGGGCSKGGYVPSGCGGKPANAGWGSGAGNDDSYHAGPPCTGADCNGRAGPANTGAGGGGRGCNSPCGGPFNGGSGIVIVAYEIGVSTKREIEQAQAEAAAREAGYEDMSDAVDEVFGD